MLKLLSLFSGIGAFEKALDNLEVPYELINFCEFDKYAVKSYCAIHDVDESKNLGDITQVDETKLPKDLDILTYGFPCQDISLAGKQKGLFNEDGSQTRSGLFFEALRIIEATKPKVAIAENVKNLVSKKFNAQFQVVLASLDAAGYNNYYAVLNAKDFGVPQNRERVFIVSIRKDIDNGLFEFPNPFPLEKRLKDVLEEAVDEKYYIDETKIIANLPNCTERITGLISKQGSQFERESEVANTLLARDYKGFGNQEMNCVVELKQVGQLYPNSGNPQAGRVYDAEGISPTVDTCSGGNRMPKVAVAMRGRYNESGQIEQQVEVSNRDYANAITTVQKDCLVGEPTIQKVDIPQVVKVRKYQVDTKKLVEVLREQKQKCGWTNKELAEELDLPITTVEHYFRTDDCFAIPEPQVWEDLKYLLEMDDIHEFDESIMTFEEKEGVFEKSERHYFTEGIAPTLTSTTTAEKIIEPSLRIRKLTPKECFRLMGFDDKSFHKAEAVNSNTHSFISKLETAL